MALKRWMYRGGRPDRFTKWINDGWAFIHSLGILPKMVTLELIGRKSGKIIRFPLAMAIIQSERYLVSMLGDQANWVRNLQASGGRATLIYGKTEQVLLREVEVAKRAPIIKAYLKIAPGARPHIPVNKDAPLAEFEAIAARFPVYQVIPAPQD